MSTIPLDLNNANGQNNGDNEHNQHSQDYRHSLSFIHDRQGRSASFAPNEHAGGFDFPISTARSTSIIGCAGNGGNAGVGGGEGGAGMDGHNAYGSISSRLDPMLLPSINSFDQQHSSSITGMQQHSNSRIQMPSTIGGSQQVPTFNSDMNVPMTNDTSSYLHDMDAIPRPGTLSNQQPQDPTSHRFLSYDSFPSHGGPGEPQGSTSKTTVTPEEMGHSRTFSSDQYEPSLPRDRRENDYLIHSQEHRRKFLGASSSQVFVKWLDEESGGLNPSSHLKHGMTSAEEMILPGQLELCHHPLPQQPDLETYVSTYFRTFHILYPVIEESWLRSQLTRPQGPHTAGGDFATPTVVYLVISLGASMTTNSQSAAVSKTYLDLTWKALSVILGRPFRSSVQALVLMAVALRLVSSD